MLQTVHPDRPFSASENLRLFSPEKVGIGKHPSLGGFWQKGALRRAIVPNRRYDRAYLELFESDRGAL
jgi:hypothetical protein